jgi:uncharacterized delta-60 repeat protein
MLKFFTFILSVTSLNLVFAQPAGSLDQSFGSAGKVTTSITNGEEKAYGVSILSNGKILVAGQASSAVTGKDFILLCYNSDGTLDNTFGNGGYVTTDIQLGSDDVAYSIAVQADGKIVLGGYSDNGSDKNAALVRYENDGSLDLTFGTNGKVLTDFDGASDEIKVIKIHALTGNIIVGGSSIISSSISKPVVARFLTDGSLDVSFNATGIKLLWITNLDYQYLFSVEDLVVQPNGKITATGWRDFPGLQWDSDYWVGRINSDGAMDNTFSTDGVNVYNGTFNGHDRAYSMILKSNNNILIAGGGYLDNLKYDYTMFEINSNGTTGSIAGSTNYGNLLDDISYALVEDINGKFVLAGSTGDATNKSFGISRKNADGTADLTFDTDGMTTTTFGANTLNECFDMQIQSDNKIVAVGYSGGDIAIARYLGNAQPQLNTFNLLLPANAATGQDYSATLLDWSDAFGATNYVIEYDISVNMTAPQTLTSTLSNKSVSGLQPNTTYFWRVKAGDGTSFGTYSNIWSFTTNSLENFNLLLPTNNAINQPFAALLCDWSNALGATSYQIEIDSNINFTDNPQLINAGNSTFYTFSDLEPGTSYFWHVRASNNGSTYGQWSNTWKFTTEINTASLNKQNINPILFYPNPATENVQIQIGENLVGTAFKIIDITGKAIDFGNFSDTKQIISIEKLPIGLYYFEIEETNSILKFIKE